MLTCTAKYQSTDKSGDVVYSFTEKTETNNELTLVTSSVCVSKAIKNTLISDTAARGDTGLV